MSSPFEGPHLQNEPLSSVRPLARVDIHCPGRFASVVCRRSWSLCVQRKKIAALQPLQRKSTSAACIGTWHMPLQAREGRAKHNAGLGNHGIGVCRGLVVCLHRNKDKGMEGKLKTSDGLKGGGWSVRSEQTASDVRAVQAEREKAV